MGGTRTVETFHRQPQPFISAMSSPVDRVRIPLPGTKSSRYGSLPYSEPNARRLMEEIVKGPQKFLVLFVFAFIAIGSSATDIYIAQNSAGGNTGADCSDAHSVSWFNSSSNWGTAAGQIGPGTTVHLCGTFNGAAGNPGPNMLTFQGSGSNNNPIILLFETGAILTAPAWGWGGVAAINLNGKSYITIDGGTPCGTTQGGVDSASACNGVIQNTANGMGLTYGQGSYAIEAQNTSNVEIRNIGIYNLYIHKAEENQGSCSAEVDQTQVAAVHIDGATGISIHDSDIHDVGWAVPGVAFGTFQLFNNQIYNMDHGLAFGNSYNTNANGPILVHDNHFGSMVNWDVEPANCDHHDGVHFWAQQNSNSGTINNVYIYNNQWDGDPGTGMNDYIFVEQAVNNVYVFNNDMAPGSTVGGHCVGCIGLGNKAPSTAGGMYAFNNTVRAAGLGYSAGTGAYFSETSNNAWMNNVVQGQNTVVAFGINAGDTPTPCSSIATLSGCVLSNAYENLQADGGSLNAFGYHSNNVPLLTTWQTGSPYLDSHYGADSGAMILSLTSFKLNSDGTLASGSPLIQAGTNLTALCSGSLAPLCIDKNGTTRPTTGSWDIGAYQYGSSAPPAPPVGLTAVVQ